MGSDAPIKHTPNPTNVFLNFSILYLVELIILYSSIATNPDIIDVVVASAGIILPAIPFVSNFLEN
jgi:hypothetical protein